MLVVFFLSLSPLILHNVFQEVVLMTMNYYVTFKSQECPRGSDRSQTT